MDNAKLIDLLNKNIEDEHGTIIQYLGHAYAIGEGEISCEIEAIAREEMRHLDWLAEMVIELGGKPSIKRSAMIPGGSSVASWMISDVELEEQAINQYSKQARLISNAKVKRLFERIISDEKVHKSSFVHFTEKVQRENLTDKRGADTDELIKTLNWGIEHEYTVILQYLFQSYMAKDEETKKQLSDQAINEMQHLGWLAEQIVDMHSNPLIEHNHVNLTTNTKEMLTDDIAIENKVAKRYDETSKRTNDESVKKLLERLRDHEIYHAEVFSDLLNKQNEKE